MVVKFVNAKKDAGKKGGSWVKDGYSTVTTSALIGKTFIIEDVDFVDGNYGKAVIFYLKGGKAFMTSSRVLIDQGEKVIKPFTDKGETVEVVLAQAIGRNGMKYLTFA